MTAAMNLLPVKTVTISSDLPPAALTDSLRGVIGSGPAAPFAGSVAADGFAITRMNEFRSTFMPLVRGSLRAESGGGTAVRLRLRPPGTVVVFMGIWLGFLAAVAVLILTAHARGAGRSLLLLLVPAALGALSWLLMTSVFAADARWAVEHLQERLPAIQPAPHSPIFPGSPDQGNAGGCAGGAGDARN